jgi:hypothetical protein
VRRPPPPPPPPPTPHPPPPSRRTPPCFPYPRRTTPKPPGGARKAPKLALQEDAARPPTELSNSFIITALQDLQPTVIRGENLTPCEYAVNRAKSLGQRHFSIVVTAYWAPGGGGVDHFSFKDVSGAYPAGYGYPHLSPEVINDWKYGLQVRGGLERGGVGSAGQQARGGAP